MSSETTGRLYLSPPHLGERERQLVLDALESNWIAPMGPYVDEFERAFSAKVGGRHSVALSSGTAALHLALILLDVGPDDTVLVSDFTFAASANAVMYVGAEPVFIDSDRDTWNMSPALLADELHECLETGRLPKAAIVVDIYGQCADYAPIREICDTYSVRLIEDAAEALGATYMGQPAGTFGDIATFSFNGNKILTSAGGGMLTTNDVHWADRARRLAAQAREPLAHYEHIELGFNYRLSNILAALGRGQLEHLAERVASRRRINEQYRTLLADAPGVSFMPIAPHGTPNFWLTCITIDPKEFGADREVVRLNLEDHNIEARPLWKPMHLQPLFSRCRSRLNGIGGDLFDHGLCLPSGSSMTPSHVERVVDTLLATPRTTHP